ncbi:MAG TPA: BACON domain-containing protein [Vicinamibacterales bacterium]|nr:BACON domain-containing protein [Vicinamibacterales bacterium]
MRYLTGVAIVLAVTVSCSRGNERAASAAPTAPSAATTGTSAASSIGGVSRPMNYTFTSQQDAYQFFGQLDIKYQVGLGRSASQTYVDLEGVVVWIQEYVRHRSNGCDHATASQRVLSQIDGGPVAAVCATVAAGQFLVGTRSDVVDMYRSLDAKYQQMGRGLRDSFVDFEGQAIWYQQYLRYRSSGCDHATALAKVFTMIDGGPEPATCYVACSYRITPDTVTTGVGALNSTFEIRPNPTACEYTLSSDSSWLTFPADQRVGNGFFNIPYSVAANLGNADRVGKITATWSTGSATFTVRQTGSPYAVSFTLVDGFRSVNTTTQCQIRSSTTPCTFTASTNLPGNNITYTWAAFYNYGTVSKIVRQANTSNVFVVNDSCGGAGSSANGEEYGMTVELRVEDDRGNIVTIQSGQGSQPNLTMKMFSCGT